MFVLMIGQVNEMAQCKFDCALDRMFSDGAKKASPERFEHSRSETNRFAV